MPYGKRQSQKNKPYKKDAIRKGTESINGIVSMRCHSPRNTSTEPRTSRVSQKNMLSFFSYTKREEEVFITSELENVSAYAKLRSEAERERSVARGDS